MSEAIINDKAPVRYLSRFYHEVDAKRRCQIPAKWLPADSDEEVVLTLVLKSSGALNTMHILVLPPACMESLYNSVTQTPFMDEMGSSLRRNLGSNSADATVDKSGRLCIPEWMASAAGLKKDVVMVGLFDVFEIWDADRLQVIMVEDQLRKAEAMKLMEPKVNKL